MSNMFLQAGFYEVNITPALARVLIHLVVARYGILLADLNGTSYKLQYLR